MQETEQEIELQDMFAEDATGNIELLSTKMMTNLAADFRNSLELRKTSSMDFEQKLNLDIIIDQLLEALQKVKINLLELTDLQLVSDNLVSREFLQLFHEDLAKYKKTMLLRESQLGSLVYLLEHRKERTFISDYLQRFGKLNQFIIEPDKSGSHINISVLEEAANIEVEFLEEYKDMINLLQLNIVHKKYLNDFEGLVKISNRLKVINSKIVSIAEIFPYACILDQNDLFSLKKTNPRWRAMLGHSIHHVFYADKQRVQKSFLQLKSGINFVSAAMSIIHQNKSLWNKERRDWGKILDNTKKMVKCVWFKENATHEAEVLISEPDSELARQIWNLPEEKIFRNVIIGILPSISYSEEIYIKRCFQGFLDSGGTTVLPQVTVENPEDYAKKLFEKVDYQRRLPMRINSANWLKFRLGTAANQQVGYMGALKSYFWKSNETPHTVIYHIHGGGFISMSSFIHQTYTRLWANNLRVPIVSVDYGKAPEHPFPEGLFDCFEGYMWLLYIFRQIFEVEPVKIILVGDSAGGNLVAALTNLLIMYQLRVPDGIVLAYPALNLNIRSYTPSFLIALNDIILPHTFLKVCLRAYIQGEDLNPKTNCLLSPLCASDSMLSQYPVTRIFVGSRDPFHDDCCRFTQRINNLRQGRCSLTIFEEFPHGFLQFDIKTQPHEYSRKAIKQVENALRDMIGL